MPFDARTKELYWKFGLELEYRLQSLRWQRNT